MTAQPQAAKPAADKLILPPADFGDDEEMLAWMEVCRRITLKAADELDEDSAHVFGKLSRFAQRQGMWKIQARRTARAVALPVSRAAEAMIDVAGYFRVASRAAEAFVEATKPPSRRREEDFKIKGSD